MRRLDWNLIENPNNEISVKAVSQAVEIISYALLLTIAGIRDYDIKDLFNYLNDLRWYDNFKEETKLVYCDYLEKPTFLYRQTQMSGTILIEFEEVLIEQ